MFNEENRIAQLKSDFFSLKADYESLCNHNNEVYQRYLQQIENIRKQKHHEINILRDKEIKAAEKNYEGQIYSANCDTNNRKSELQKKLTEFIVFKNRSLESEFKSISGYFKSHGYNFWDEIKNQNKKEKPDGFISVIQSKEHLLTEKEIQEDIEKVTKTDKGRPTGIETGMSIQIMMNEMPGIAGKVGAITDKYFELILDNNKILKISFIAVNLGRARIMINN